MTVEDLARELTRLTEGMSTLEKALIVAESLRKIDGEWVIEMDSNGVFVIRRPKTR